MPADNLDRKCARAAEQLVQKAGGHAQLEKLCVDGSAVLSANGPYAFYLYLRSRDPKKTPSETVSAVTFELLLECFPEMGPKFSPPDARTMLNQVLKLSEDLDDLMLAKRLLTRILTYVRYHARASTGGSR